MIVMCVCGGRGLVSEEKIALIREYLAGEGRAYSEFSDFCDYTELGDDVRRRLSEAKNIVVMACFPRTIRSFFHTAGIPLENKRLVCINLREMEHEEIVKALAEAGEMATGEPVRGDSPDKLSSWFPLIDAELCSNCGRCLEFCLFGVYGRGEGGRIKAVSPKNCKDNCPACARICPKGAIIFPKSKESPINGEEITGEQGGVKNIPDLEEKSLDNFYQAMETRKNRRNTRKLTKE